MSNPFCPICNERLSGPKAYCTLAHRDRAKYLRRKARERKAFVRQADASGATVPSFWPDPPDQGTLAMFIESLEAGGEVWFEGAGEFASWQAPDGFTWEVLTDGKGRLRKL